MLTQTSQSARIEISAQQLGEILAKHFKKDIKMTPTETDVYFESGGYDSRDYTNTVNVITLIAKKTVNHEASKK